MSKCSEIRDFCGDYAFDVEYSEDNEFTMFFNSRRNAETVKRCIEVDYSVPNVATAVDFVEVVRCKDCKYYEIHKPTITLNCEREGKLVPMMPNDYCSYGERREE
jgi:hypothetical protein